MCMIVKITTEERKGRVVTFYFSVLFILFFIFIEVLNTLLVNNRL